MHDGGAAGAAALDTRFDPREAGAAPRGSALAVFFVLSKILDVFLSPYTWTLALVALAIPWRRPHRRDRWRSRRAAGGLGLALLIFFSLEPVSSAILYRLEHATSPTYRADVAYDAVVLLGGVVDTRVTEQSGQPAYNDSVERLVATHRLVADGRARVVIISAAPDAPERAEAGEGRVLARQLVAWGVDPSRILLEEGARNTRENALYTQRIAREHGLGRVVIVTSAFHMKRARECFAAVGMDVDTLPVDYRAPRGEWGVSRSWLPRARALADSSGAVREMFGLYVYRLRGYARPAS